MNYHRFSFHHTLRFGLLIVAMLVPSFSQSADSNLPQVVLDEGFDDVRIALFEPDIELQRVLASGRLETRADWTETGKELTRKWVESFFETSDIGYAELTIPEDASGDRLRQMMALHRAVGYSILTNDVIALPTKKGKFEWSIGPGAAELGEAADADYGLFVFYRRGYTTAGRAASVVVGALLGVGLVGAYQQGFATLVDLKSGEFVWFHSITSSRGDMREEDSAQHTVAALLSEFPGLTLPDPPENTSIGGAQ